MKFTKFMCALIVLTIITHLNAQIFESYSIKDILQFTDPNDNKDDVLFLFDIDNTIAKSSQIIGTSEYFYHMVEQIGNKTGLSRLNNINLFVPFYNCIQMRVPLELVEPDALRVVHTLQKNNYHVLGFTLRNLELAQHTNSQLETLSINFNKTTVFDIHELAFTVITPALYRSGIIFCNGNNKGKTLTALFKLFNYTPKKVIFIDDEKRHIESVQTALENLGIECSCIWYRHINTATHLNLEKAEEELYEFCKHDDDAASLYEQTIGNILNPS